ncbi:MAG: YHYH protein, partial [Solirubrobacterales bacterium]|nr:YHYH protein [Solirubrobacterales bacterium]
MRIKRTHHHRLLTAVSASALLALAACGEVTASGSTAKTTATTTAATTSSSTKAGLKKTKWGTNMTVNYGTSTIRLRSNGIPNHSRSKYYAVPNAGVVVPTAATATAALDPTKTQSYDYKITTTPKKISKTTAAPLGSIGMMISGSVLFNPYEGDGNTVAMASNFTIAAPDGSTAPFVDDCSGHPTPAMGGGGGQYHYHGLPACVSKEVDTSTGPSHILGVAFDGFPIYGKRDINGKVISVSKLDKCNGITSATPEFPNGIYHYVLPGTTNSTSSIRCFHGKVDPSLITRMPNMGG